MKIQRSGSVGDGFYSSLKKILIAQGKEPWQLTQQEFMDYHYSGGIPESAYKAIAHAKALNGWVQSPNTRFCIARCRLEIRK